MARRRCNRRRLESSCGNRSTKVGRSAGFDCVVTCYGRSVRKQTRDYWSPFAGPLSELSPLGRLISRSHTLPRLTRYVLTAAVLVVSGFAAWINRDTLLRDAAERWTVSDPVGPSDVAVVLGGGIEDRPFAAAAYFREGLVQKILVSNPSPGPAEQLGALKSDNEANEDVLRKLGVPESAIEPFGGGIKNTRDEAVALRDWMQHNDAKSAIIPTEIFSARRVRWIMRRILGDGVLIRVTVVKNPEYNAGNWWHEPESLIVFENEILKYIYYRIEY